MKRLARSGGARRACSWVVVLSVLGIGGAAVAVPTAVPYVGHLSYADSGAPYVGPPVTVRAALYDTASPDVDFDAPVWGPFDYPNTTVELGVFSLVLGAVGTAPIDTALLNASDLFIVLHIGGEPMLPGQRLLSVPYSIRSGDSENLGGLPATDFATTGEITTAIGGLAAVATTGAYADLSGAPNLPANPRASRNYHGRVPVGPDDPAEIMVHFEDAAHVPTSVRMSLKAYRFPRMFYTELGGHAHTASAASAGGHSHTTGAAGNHTHSTTTNGAHTHTINSVGNHSHHIRTGDAGGAGKPGDHSYNGSYAGGASLCSWQGGWHSLLACSTGADGNYATSTSGGHTHSMGSAGGHSHTANAAGSHSHSVSNAGSHTHAVSVTSAGASVAANSTTLEHLSGLRVFVNGSERTSDLLTALGWGAIGDGTAGHPLVASGTGLVDITSFVPLAPGTHTIRFESSSGTGGMLLYDVMTE